MFSFILVSISVLLLSILAKYHQMQKKPDSCFSKRLPRVKWTFMQLPIVDGFIFLLKIKNDGLKAWSDLAKKYGKVFTVPLAETEVVVISDPDIIQKVLKSTENGHLNKIKRIYDVIFSDGLKDGLVPSDVSIWAPHRKIISRAFTYKSFITYVKIMNEGSKELAQTACAIASGSAQNTISGKQIGDLINHCAVKNIAEIIMGSGALKTVPNNERDEVLEAFKRGKDIASERMVKPMLLIKPIWLLHPKKRELDHAIQLGRRACLKLANLYRMKEILEINDDLEANSTTNPTAEDDRLYGCAMEEMIKANFTDKEIADEVGMLMAAGHDTVVTALSFLTFHLALNLEQQQNCHLEVDTFFSSRTSEEIEDLGITDYSELKYLERCIYESLRLVPTIPIFGRKLESSLHISEDMYIEAGRNIIISPWIVHRDPDIYPNPEVFDPDRFLSENVKKRHSHSYIPFSLGVRNCIGWKVALMEMKIIMTWILKDFEITTTDKPDDVKILFGLTVKPKREYDITLKKRVAI